MYSFQAENGSPLYFGFGILGTFGVSLPDLGALYEPREVFVVFEECVVVDEAVVLPEELVVALDLDTERI